MEYDQLTNLERLSGKALFKPDGELSYIDVGNIRMHKVDYGVERKQFDRSRDGKRFLRREDTIIAKPVLQLTVDEWATPVVPLLLLGEQLADVSQASGTGTSVTFTSKKGRNFDLGAININTVAMTTPVGKTVNVDWTEDLKRGYIYIPLTSTIADGTSVTVTFNKPALTFEQFKAFTKLNRAGTMVVHESDEYSDVPKATWTFPNGQLSADNRGEVKLDDATTADLRFSIQSLDGIIIKKRPGNT